MNMMKKSTFTVVLVLLQLLLPAAAQDVVRLVGTGTSNPSMCFWHVLESMMSQTRIPTLMTYRSTSSGPGQTSFIGNITHPFSDFSSGYPLSKDNFTHLRVDNGVDFIQLPALLGAMGIFHRLPIEGNPLNLTACIVAKIYKRDIKDWTHPDIVEINPNLNLPPKFDSYGNVDKDQSFPIYVVHREPGSSSSITFTKYLHKACPAVWPEELVGPEVDFNADTKTCLGNLELAKCVSEKEGAIGYIDSGIGHDEGLAEAALRIDTLKDTPFYLTSLQAIDKGGILSAVEDVTAGIPAKADGDWSNMDLVNKVDGYLYTWPMVHLSMLYIRKNLSSFMPDPRAQGLLVAFLKNLYDPAYFGVCERRYRFVAVKGGLKELALEGISMLELSPDAPEWKIETDFLPEDEIDDYVISTRRKNTIQIEQDILIDTVKEEVSRLDSVVLDMDALRDKLAEASKETSALAVLIQEENDTPDFDGQDQTKLDVSFILSIVSMSLWFVTFIFLCRLERNMRQMTLAAQQAAPEQAKTKSRRKEKSGESTQ